MRLKKIVPAFLFLLTSILSVAQEDSLKIGTTEQILIVEEDFEPYDPLAPARAAFYSAILPGLGQAYNEKYWKIPLVYAGIGAGVYFYLDNDQEYDRYRTAYKRRLAGFEDDEFFGRVSTDALIRAQRFYQKNKEISLLVTAGFYILNIIDANVDAHLRQFNVSEDLSLKPTMNINEYTGKAGYGLSLNYNF